MVVAAGNDNDDACDYSPGSAADAITVGASTSSDEAAYYSNYGSCVDIYAPGSNIYSAEAGDSNGYAYASGTSMACPHVSGVAATMLGEQPDMTPQEVSG